MFRNQEVKLDEQLRKLPIGAEPGPDGVNFRVWAPDHQKVEAVIMGEGPGVQVRWRELHLAPLPEPMLAPPEGCHWELLWTSEKLDFGGSGTPRLDTINFWRLQGHAAVVLLQVPNGDAV